LLFPSSLILLLPRVAVGDKDAIDTKLSWRWARDNFFLPSDNIWLLKCKQKTSGWIPMDTVKTLSDASLAKDWLPSEIAHDVRGMEHRILLIETTHDPGDALVKFATMECPRDAIMLLGCRGRQGWRRMFLGSVTLYVTQHAPIAVLVVRSRKYRDIPDLTSDTVGAAYLGMTTPGKQRKVAIAIDGTSQSVALVRWAMSNALKPRDEVHLLHSAASENPEATLKATAAVNECMAALSEFQRDDEGLCASVLLDMKGDTRDNIVDYVEDQGGAIDFLVMGTRGLTGNLKRAMLGSVSSYALAYCPSPVLTVPADIVAEAAKPTEEEEPASPSA